MAQNQSEETIEALRRAVAAVPGDNALRMHLAQVLISAGREPEAVTELANVLAAEPSHQGARALMMSALGAPPAASTATQSADHAPVPPLPFTAPPPPPLPSSPTSATPSPSSSPSAGPPTSPTPLVPPGPHLDPPTDRFLASPADDPTAEQAGTPSAPPPRGAEFDWTAAESQLGDIAKPMFMNSEGDTPEDEPAEAFSIERPTVRLTDVGGMQDVKNRLHASFLAPLQNPELRKLYGKSLRGGLLLYGPPGCGKTFLARALAGELGASFISAGLSDILDMWIGSSEKNLHELFSQARRAAPCVLFLDEIDALAQKRTQTRNSATRGVVNQLLSELDGVATANEGVYILAATNQPWDIDPAMRRPGRLDRTVLVLPPDGPAREAIFRYHLSTRPIEGVDLKALSARSEGLSGADIAYVCELATENALMDGVNTGHARLMSMKDLDVGLRQVRPSTGAWLDTVKTVVQYGEDDGTFAELKAYLKKTRRW